MKIVARLGLIVLLLFAFIFLSEFLRHRLRSLHLNAYGIEAIASLIGFIAWITPVIALHRFRDVGSFRLGWHNSVLLIMPWVACVFYFAKPIQDIHWGQIGFCLIAAGILRGAWEELVFRGYIFRYFSLIYPKTTVLISSMIFGLLHSSEGWQKVVIAGLFLGVGLGIVRMATGSLLVCMLLHGIINAINGFVTEGIPIDVAYPIGFTMAGISLATLVLWKPCHTQFPAGLPLPDSPKS